MLVFGPQGRGFKPGTSKRQIHHSEAWPQRTSLLKIEEPSTDLVTFGADGDLMKKTTILFLRAVLGEHTLQGFCIEVFMFHTVISSFELERIEEISYRGPGQYAIL
jgi:hypothetical protein